MIEYNCPRCGYNTKKRCNIKRHLNRKKMCDGICEDISIEECKSRVYMSEQKNELETYTQNIHKIKENYTEEKDKEEGGFGKEKISCEICNKELSTYCSKWRHRAYYCKGSREEKKEIEGDLKELQKKYEELTIKLEEVIQKQTEQNIIKNTNSINAIITNNNNSNNTTININVYGKEDISHITRTLVKYLAEKRPAKAIPIMAKEIYSKKKENHTVVLAGGHKSGKVKVHKGNNRWIYRDKCDVIDEMGTKAIEVMTDTYDNLENTKFSKVQDDFETYKNPTYTRNCKEISIILDNMYVEEKHGTSKISS